MSNSSPLSIRYEGQDPGVVTVANGTVFPAEYGMLQENRVCLYGHLTSLGDKMLLQYLVFRRIAFEIQRVDVVLLENFSKEFQSLLGSDGGVPIVTVDSVVVTPKEGFGSSWFGVAASDKMKPYLYETVRTCDLLDGKLRPEEAPFVVESDGVLDRSLEIHKDLVLLCFETFIRPRNGDRAVLWRRMLEAKAAIASAAVESVRSNRYSQQLTWLDGSESKLPSVLRWLDWLDTQLAKSPHGWVTHFDRFTAADAACAITLNKLLELQLPAGNAIIQRPAISAYLDRLSQMECFKGAFLTFSAWENWPTPSANLFKQAMGIFDVVTARPQQASEVCNFTCAVDPFLKFENFTPSHAPSPSSVILSWLRPGANLHTLVTQLWFCRNPARKATVDAHIKAVWGDTVIKARAGELRSWEQDTEGLLALIILLDQWSRHVLTGAEKYSGDAKALEYARRIVSSTESYSKLSLPARLFVLLPYEHSEDAYVQREADELFRELIRESKSWQDLVFYSLIYYRKLRHEEVVKKYQEFPSRRIDRNQLPIDGVHSNDMNFK